jgi:toxin CcdB
MARFDVHRNVRTSRVPLLLDVQGDHLNQLRTRLVVPLVPLEKHGAPLRILNPVFAIAGERYIMATPDMAGVHITSLGEVVLSLREHHFEIVRAIDFLLQGY